MKSLIAPGVDGSYSSFTRHPHSWLGKTAPSATDIVPSFYKDRPASVSVLGKKISADAVVTVNADAKFCPRPVSFESAKPKQHFQRSRQLQDISNKPSAPRANSAVNPKILSKIKIYAEARSAPRNRKNPTDDKPAKKPRPPKAPRPDKSKGKKKAAVPRLATESVAKAPRRESPNINVVPKIDEIVQQSLKEAYETKLRDEEERQRKQETEHLRKQQLKQQNLQVRRENKRFQGGQFKPRAAWGTDERRIYGQVDEKSKLEARMDRESKLLRRKRAKSAGKDHVGLEALNEIKAELRPSMRSQSVMTKPHAPRSGRGSPAKEIRMPDPAIKDYMKYKKQETRDLHERECISQLAMEAKRLSQLKDLEVKAKVAIQKFKRKRRQTHKRPRPLDLLMTDLSQTGTNPEDDEVLGIMHRLGDRRPELDEREGRESRVFGVLPNQPSLTEERGNATQVLTVDRRDDGLFKQGNITAPMDLKAEWNSSHDDLLLDSQLSSLPRLIDPIESSLFEDEDSDLQLSEISKRKEDIRKKVADLRRRADEVKLKVRDEVEIPLRTEGSEGTPLNLPVIKAADFEQMMQEEAAIKIQSNIRRFLAMSLLEQLKAELSPVDDLSFHSEDIDEEKPKKSKLSDRLRIGIRTEVIYSDDESEPGLLGSDSHMDLGEYEDAEEDDDAEEDEDAEDEESFEVRRPTSDPYRRPRSAEQSKDSDDLDQFFTGSRPANPDPEDFEYDDDRSSQGELQSILLHELQSMKSREQALEDLIEQANSRQQAEEVKHIQMKEDLAKLREYDRHMLEEVAARSGASMLTELLSKLFDQRYKRLEELFKGNRKALQEAISGDLPYFEQLEQCLKEAEEAKKTGRGEATSIERLLDHLIENSEEVPKSSQDSILESRDESASFDLLRGKDQEAARRTNFAEEIAKLEQELYEQEEPIARKLGSSGRQGLSRQPFSGMLVGLDSLKDEEPEQHISDLSAEIESSYDSETSVQVFSRPFDVVPVYISTEEDIPSSPIHHQESPVCVDSVAFDFPVLHKPLFESRDELVPSIPEIPVSPVVTGKVAQKKPESPVVSHEKPVVSPEKPMSPVMSSEKPVSPVVSPEKPMSPVESSEKPVVPMVSPEKPVSPDRRRPKVELKLDDILLEDSEGDLREAEYTQVNIADENLVDEILEHLLDEAIDILHTQLLIHKPAIQSPGKGPQQDLSSSQGAQSTDISSRKVEELKSQDQRLDIVNAKEERPSPQKAKGEVTRISVGAELAEEILIDLLKAELNSFPYLGLSPHKKQLPSMPELSLNELGSQHDNCPSYSVDLGLRTDVEAVISYVDEVFNSAFNPQELPLGHFEGGQALHHADLKGWKGNPLQTNPSLVLEQLQNSELTSFSGLALTKPPEVINVECYIELEKARNALSSRQAMLSPNTAQAVSEAGNIHNKMIFDCINEALARLLPYGLKGVPMPWSANTRALAPELVNEARVLAEVKKNIGRWCSIQAGKLPSGDMVMSSGLMDEEYLQHVRVERLEACISLELLENDDVWVDYEFEETQAKLDVADMVLDHLVNEAVSIMQDLTR
jgi:hypothetical protein